MATSAAKSTSISATQEQLLQALAEGGGLLAFRPLFRSAFGVRWEDVSPTDRNRYFSNLRALERKGLASIARRWGAWGYGQPETVAITEQGRAAVVTQ